MPENCCGIGIIDSLASMNLDIDIMMMYDIGDNV